LTKAVSPTSPLGKSNQKHPGRLGRQSNSPSVDCHWLRSDLCGSFVDVNIKHLSAILKRAAEHKGTSFVEVYQNCKRVQRRRILKYATDRETKADTVVELEHGKR